MGPSLSTARAIRLRTLPRTLYRGLRNDAPICGASGVRISSVLIIRAENVVDIMLTARRNPKIRNHKALSLPVLLKSICPGSLPHPGLFQKGFHQKWLHHTTRGSHECDTCGLTHTLACIRAGALHVLGTAVVGRCWRRPRGRTYERNLPTWYYASSVFHMLLFA